MKKIVITSLAAIIAIFVLTPFKADAACLFHNIGGYIWSGNTGWISLNCNNISDASDIDYGLNIDFDSVFPSIPVTGYAWSSNSGWLDFQPSTRAGFSGYPASPAYDARFNRSDPGDPESTAGTITGWAKWVALGTEGWVRLSANAGDPFAYQVNVGADRLFEGYSWNGGSNVDADPEPERGDGWIRWDSTGPGGGIPGGGASILAYWFETKYGDIYSGGDISAPFAPLLSRYSATYLIQSNGTIAPVVITSEADALDASIDNDDPYIADDSFGVYSLPDQANNYRGTLGWLDKAGMLAGRYVEVTEYAGTKTKTTIGQNVTLEGKIYRYTGNVTVDKAIDFKKGTAGKKGNGTIIVEGDLFIDNNITYSSGAISGNVNQLPSVAWIVKGNIEIDPSVTEIDGLFFSEGETPGLDGKYGIKTGTTGASSTDVQLVIKGMLIAKKIHLQRLFIKADLEDPDSPNEPAEQIFFDGRAIVNPPPGLTDIAKGLPALREARP